MAQYVYDQTWKDERERLAGIERLWDEGTQAILARLGVAEGWRCLDVGAGGGSVTEWLAGRGAEVVATDVDTRFLTPLDERFPNVEVRELDFVGGDVPDGDFDLVYARLVAEHLGPVVIERMLAAAKPGGVVVLEDYDFSSAGTHPPDESFETVNAAVLAFMEKAGFDPLFGRRLVSELKRLGADGVAAEGRVRVIEGGTPDTAFFRLSLETLRGGLVEAGLLTDDQIANALGDLDEPGRIFLSPILVAASGRRPPASNRL